MINPGTKCLEETVLKAVNKEDFSEQLRHVAIVYGLDIEEYRAQTELEVLGASTTNNKITDIRDVISYLQNLSSGEQRLLVEVMTMVKLILVIPATYKAGSERFFSTMRQIKAYLISTMSQSRLDHLTASVAYP